jgi:hypothetical protein
VTPAVLDNGQHSPRKLLATVVRRFLLRSTGRPLLRGDTRFGYPGASSVEAEAQTRISQPMRTSPGSAFNRSVPGPQRTVTLPSSLLIVSLPSRPDGLGSRS